MLSTINGLDLLLVFTIIGIGYYASIQSDNADIATAKLETMRLASVEDSREYHAMCEYIDAQRKQAFEIIKENRSLQSELDELSMWNKVTTNHNKDFTDYLDHTNLWQEFNVYTAETRAHELAMAIDPWGTPPQTEPTYCELDCTGSDHLTRPCF